MARSFATSFDFARSEGGVTCGPASSSTLLNVATLVSELLCAVTARPARTELFMETVCGVPSCVQLVPLVL